RALRSSSVVVIGAGGLGSPVLLYLVAAGFGKVGIVDDDRVNLSNLQRQVIHDESSIGQLKTDSAAARLRALNSDCTIVAHSDRLSTNNAVALIESYDIVIDGTDNLPTRYLVNDACIRTGRPLVHGSVFRFEGQVSVFGLDDGPCYRCLFPTPPPPDLVPTCEAAGVLGVVPGIVGMYQATEAIKIATGLGKSLSGRLLLIDSLSNEHTQLELIANPNCPTCSVPKDSIVLMDYTAFCGSFGEIRLMNTKELADRINVEVPTTLLLDVREANERMEGHLGGIHIPLGELRLRLNEITERVSNEDLVVYCRSGVRSADAARIIQRTGITSVYSLDGGLLAWNADMDSGTSK
ncbi:MAG: molybdenum cofactor biosynthesis protein MoeB, partial [Rhodothermales bacterium]|nr:molybdenum cofactor biosynthesis protein MoeB [Rhodothermales bacterium]